LSTVSTLGLGSTALKTTVAMPTCCRELITISIRETEFLHRGAPRDQQGLLAEVFYFRSDLGQCAPTELNPCGHKIVKFGIF